jgi:hypothetical protein
MSCTHDPCCWLRSSMQPMLFCSWASVLPHPGVDMRC